MIWCDMSDTDILSDYMVWHRIRLHDLISYQIIGSDVLLCRWSDIASDHWIWYWIRSLDLRSYQIIDLTSHPITGSISCQITYQIVWSNACQIMWSDTTLDHMIWCGTWHAPRPWRFLFGASFWVPPPRCILLLSAISLALAPWRLLLLGAFPSAPRPLWRCGVYCHVLRDHMILWSDMRLDHMI